MLDKFTTFTIKKDSLKVIGVETTNNELIKTASFKLPDGVDYDPDFFYMKVRAVSAGEYWGCFPAGNKVLMADGSYKDIKNVVAGEYVITDKGNIKKVLSKFEREYNGDMCEISSNRSQSTITCTSEHPVLNIKEKDLLCKHDKYVRCLPQFVGKRNICNRQYTHCNMEVPFKEEWSEASTLNCDDYVAYKYYNTNSEKIFSDDEMYFMGLYLAEGSISQASKNTKEIRLTFGLHEKDTLVKYLLEIIAPKINFKSIKGPYINKGKSTASIAIFDQDWVEKLEKYCGKKSYGKFIHASLKSTKNINCLLQGCIDGDGHIDKTDRVVIVTVSEQLGRDLFDISIKCGYTPFYCVHKHLNKKLKDRHQISFPSNNVDVSNFGIKKNKKNLKQDKSHAFIYHDKLYTKISNINRYLFTGTVYNLEIECDNSYIVNGICVHNCNKNADYFPEEELKKSFQTFLSAHAFKNHENKDIANAIGDVLAADWDDMMKCIVLLIRIDRRIAPTIVRGFEKGFMTDVSMGCRIEYSICSYCGNKAKTKDQYCDHVKLMRGKLFSNGKRVYEVNIGPRFHDISAVLNGAEKSAKVLGMLIVGNKVALEFGEDMEKTASFSDELKSLLNEMEKAASVSDNEKVAKEVIAEDVDLQLDEEPSFIDKVAEIKKEIQGRVEEIAKGEVLTERFKNADELRATLNLLYNKYWDNAKCKEIAKKIKEVANRKNISCACAFKQFLNVLDFAGIELSPHEFNDIYLKLIDCSAIDYRRTFPFSCMELDPIKLMSASDTGVENNYIPGINFPTMFNTIGALLPSVTALTNKFGNENVLPKIKTIIIKIKKDIPEETSDVAYSDMMNFVKDLMPQRSMHRRFFIKRASELGEPHNNTAHFVLTGMLKTAQTNEVHVGHAVASILYSTYQHDRVENINNNEIDRGLTKFASYIEGDTIDNIFNDPSLEKTAKWRPIMYGLPLTFGYSALQRSRIKNGENVSGLNRYIAENPQNAFLLQAIFGNKALNAIKKAGKKVNQKGFEISNKFAPKIASEYGDMFKNASIDGALLEHYNHSQINALKKATIFRAMERQDISDEVLANEKLAESDLEQYLQICKNCIKIEVEKDIEKTAGFDFAKDTAINALGDTAFNPIGTSGLSTLPGNLIDGMVLTWAARKILSKNNPKTKPKNVKEFKEPIVNDQLK